MANLAADGLETEMSVRFGAEADVQAEELAMEALKSTHVDTKRSFSISIGASVDDASETENADDSNADPQAKRQLMQQQALQVGADALGISYDEMVQVTEILNALFSGRMTAEQTDALVSWFERSAQDVSIVQREDGLYVLSAARLDLSSLPMDEEALAELSQNSFEIGYRPETGVEYAAILNMGTDNGRMVFEFVDRDIDDDVFDSTRYSDDPTVRKLDLNKSFGGLFSGFNFKKEPPAEDNE
jgi:hypothetical protein